MPVNSNGRSVLAGLGLFMAFIVFCYLESTTTNPVFSLIYVGGVVVTILAACSKWGSALGVEHGLARFADIVASAVPLMSFWFLGLQALKYNRDGLEGFMACFSIGTIVILVAFGVADTLSSWFGSKYKQATEALDEGTRRVSSAVDAMAGNRR